MQQIKTLNEYEKWFLDLKEKKRDDKMNFVWSLMKSPYIEYHYDLIRNKNKIDSHFWLSLRGRFDEHGVEGGNFLLKKLDDNEDVDFHGEIIFLLGKLNSADRKTTIQYARKLTESEDDYTRDRAIIVLGWIGGIKELDILRDRLLNDNNANCRAWSASSFMQMSFKSKSEKLRKFALNAFKESLEKETDYFVLSSIIVSIREIENNRFGISQTSLDNLEKEKIDIAKKRIKRYIIKEMK